MHFSATTPPKIHLDIYIQLEKEKRLEDLLSADLPSAVIFQNLPCIITQHATVCWHDCLVVTRTQNRNCRKAATLGGQCHTANQSVYIHRLLLYNHKRYIYECISACMMTFFPSNLCIIAMLLNPTFTATIGRHTQHNTQPVYSSHPHRISPFHLQHSSRQLHQPQHPQLEHFVPQKYTSSS